MLIFLLSLGGTGIALDMPPLSPVTRGWIKRTGIAAVALAAAFAAGAAQAEPAQRVVVFPLRNLGIDEDVAASLLGFLRSEVAKLPGITLLDLAKSGKLVGGDCRGEVKCVAAAGRKVNAEEAICGTVAAVGEAYSIDLKLVQVRGAREEGRVTETLSGERELLIDGVRAAAYKLLLPDKYVGAIQIDLSVNGAEVFVDGRPSGKTPLRAPISDLAPGKHALKIVKQGFADFDKWVDVKFSRVSVVRVDLENSAIEGVMYASEPVDLPAKEADRAAENAKMQEKREQGKEAASSALRSDSPPPSWLGKGRKIAIATAAGGLALVAAGGVLGVLSDSDRAALEKLQIVQPDGARGPVADKDREKAANYLSGVKTKSTVANVLFGVGGAAILTGAVLFFTQGPTSTAQAPADAPAGPQLAPVVLFAPGGGGSVGVAGVF
jgi:hypothetical protein